MNDSIKENILLIPKKAILYNVTEYILGFSTKNKSFIFLKSLLK